ncbi:uncharacterized protein LOC141899960 isoform X2 [Tubulanus polymorphus]|uniref:uncharacterized protein LOC141899960 isoform X2 n=1 Tax=Tubulanus polymorphus TaxID=672921 RepID=UPI003DA3ED38
MSLSFRALFLGVMAVTIIEAVRPSERFKLSIRMVPEDGFILLPNENLQFTCSWFIDESAFTLKSWYNDLLISENREIDGNIQERFSLIEFSKNSSRISVTIGVSYKNEKPKKDPDRISCSVGGSYVHKNVHPGYFGHMKARLYGRVVERGSVELHCIWTGNITSGSTLKTWAYRSHRTI